MRYIIVDIATAALPNAAEYLEDPYPDARLTDPVKIAKSIADKRQDQLDRCGLDLDLARLTAIGWVTDSDGPAVLLCKDEDEERAALKHLASLLRDEHNAQRTIISYNGHAFDLLVLMRRARYLGVTFPKLSTDRYKSTNIDLLLELSDRDPQRKRSLGFYVRRLGLDITKPLTGEQESHVPDTGQWDELERSVLHDLEATRALACWLGVIA